MESFKIIMETLIIGIVVSLIIMAFLYLFSYNEIRTIGYTIYSTDFDYTIPKNITLEVERGAIINYDELIFE